MPRALERSPQSCEWPLASGAVSVQAGLFNDPAVDRNAALGWLRPVPSMRFYVKPESIPATSAFMGSNPENCVQPTLDECFVLKASVERDGDKRSHLKESCTTTSRILWLGRARASDKVCQNQDSEAGEFMPV
jgi:hypothetical protein